MRSLVHATVRIMRKEVPASSRLRNRIIQNRRLLRDVANPEYSLSRKKKYLIQKGGGVSGIAKLFTSLTRLMPLMRSVSTPALSRLPSLMRASSLQNLSRLQAPSHVIRAG